MLVLYYVEETRITEESMGINQMNSIKSVRKSSSNYPGHDSHLIYMNKLYSESLLLIFIFRC